MDQIQNPGIGVGTSTDADPMIRGRTSTILSDKYPEISVPMIPFLPQFLCLFSVSIL
jgi:hypothetical protein